jgi:hypothetical protein
MDKNNICHFVCSRFNLYLKENIIKYKWDISEDEWMEKHLDAFEMGLIPSLKNQTCQNFNYICWFDERTSQKHRDRIDTIKKNFSNFYPLYIDLIYSPKESIYPEEDINDVFFLNYHKNYIKNICGENKKIILQTRVDIDDYLHKNFINIIQENIEYYFKKQFKDNLILYNDENKIKKIISVYFPVGYYVHMEREPREFLKVRKLGNQFCTIIEHNNENLTGIWDAIHISWRSLSSEIVLDIEEPMWIWTIHDNNFGHKKHRTFKKHDYNFRYKYDKNLFYDNFAFNDEYSKKLVN